MGRRDDGGAVEHSLGWLLEVSHLAGSDQLPALVSESARRAGALDAGLYLVTHEQTLLVPLADGDPIPVEGTDAGTAFSHVDVLKGSENGETLLWVPLLDGTDRLGVVRFHLAELDDPVVRRCRQLAGLYAELAATRSAFSDLIELRRRTQPRSLASELMSSLLPPLTHAREQVVISCMLAPCYDVGGDAFDYAVDGGHARFAIFDGMGHGLGAALLTAVAISAYRRARRRSMSLEDTYAELTEAILEHFGTASFVTGVLCDLDLETGVLRRINAGHPVAIRLRHDGRVEELPLPRRSPPFGVGQNATVIEASLDPGDRLVFYTDGVVEARDASGDFFGVQRLLDLILSESRAGHPAPELLRRVSLAVGAHQSGVFQDDATTMIVEWRTDDHERVVF